LGVWREEGVTIPYSENQHVTKCYTRPRTWEHSLEQPKLWKIGWKLNSKRQEALYARFIELAEDDRKRQGGTESEDDCILFCGNENEIIN
jgi:hypothetical protein